jgi:hypothetical protein
MTPALAVVLCPAESAHVRLVATSYPVRVVVTDLEHFIDALVGALGELAKTAGVDLDVMGAVIEGERRVRGSDENE